MERLKQYSSWIIIALWGLVVIGGMLVYLKEDARNKEQEGILITELVKNNKELELTASMRPKWTSILTEHKNMMYDIEGRQRVIIESQEAAKQRDRKAEELLKELQNQQEQLKEDFHKLWEMKEVSLSLQKEIFEKLENTKITLEKKLAPK